MEADKPINAESIHDKIYRGLLNAQEKLFREQAFRQESLVVCRDGEIIRIPAQELLVELQKQKKEHERAYKASSLCFEADANEI